MFYTTSKRRGVRLYITRSCSSVGPTSGGTVLEYAHLTLTLKILPPEMGPTEKQRWVMGEIYVSLCARLDK